MLVNFEKLKKSFCYAFEGLKTVFQEEQSFRLQVVIAGLVLLLMFLRDLHEAERAVLVLAMGFVLGLELLNSQLERILDVVNPEHDKRIKAIKDVSAAAVLIAVFTAVLVGILIFFW